MRIRRTKEEIAAGVTLKDKMKEKEKKNFPAPSVEEKVIPDTQQEKERIKEVIKEVTKEVRILGLNGTERTVAEFLDDEFAKVSWEWKEVPINDDFRLEILSSLGKEGWKFAFIHPTKNDIIYMHRYKRKKQ